MQRRPEKTKSLASLWVRLMTPRTEAADTIKHDDVEPGVERPSAKVKPVGAMVIIRAEDTDDDEG